MNSSKNRTVDAVFPVSGMSCAACAARVGQVLRRQEGVAEASVNYAASTAGVRYDPALCTPETLRRVVQEAGYDLLLSSEGEAFDAAEREREAEYRALRRRAVWALSLAVPVAVVGMVWGGEPWAGYLLWLLSTPVVFVLGGGFYAVLNLYYYALVILRKQKLIFGIYVVLTVLAAILAPKFTVALGIFGAALAYLILMVVMAAGFVGGAWIEIQQEIREVRHDG